MGTMDELRCEVYEEAGGMVLRLDGQFAYAAMEEFEKHVLRLLDRRPKLLVVDLSGVRFISSAGIGALLKLHRRMLPVGCQVKLAAAHPETDRILRMTNIQSVVPMVATVSEALGS